MKVQLGTVEIDDGARRAINDYYGRPGLATRATVRGLFLSLALADLQSIESDYLERMKQEKEKVPS